LVGCGIDDVGKNGVHMTYSEKDGGGGAEIPSISIFVSFATLRCFWGIAALQTRGLCADARERHLQLQVAASARSEVVRCRNRTLSMFRAGERQFQADVVCVLGFGELV
jgi:hypothetical protein